MQELHPEITEKEWEKIIKEIRSLQGNYQKTFDRIYEDLKEAKQEELGGRELNLDEEAEIREEIASRREKVFLRDLLERLETGKNVPRYLRGRWRN